jgi:hypothetical protein
LGADATAFTPDRRKIVLQAKRYGATSEVTGPDLPQQGHRIRGFPDGTAPRCV